MNPQHVPPRITNHVDLVKYADQLLIQSRHADTGEALLGYILTTTSITLEEISSILGRPLERDLDGELILPTILLSNSENKVLTHYLIAAKEGPQGVPQDYKFIAFDYYPSAQAAVEAFKVLGCPIRAYTRGITANGTVYHSHLMLEVLP
jgi:hypothetical protein